MEEVPHELRVKRAENGEFILDAYGEYEYSQRRTKSIWRLILYVAEFFEWPVGVEGADPGGTGQGAGGAFDFDRQKTVEENLKDEEL